MSEADSDHSPTAFPSITLLPDDIIQEIFIWYVNDDPFVDVPFHPSMEEEKYTPSPYWDSDSEDDDEYSDSPDELEISSHEEQPFINLPLPFVISRVCSAWRRVASSTPRLWSNVCIETFDPCSKRLAAEWLLKAGSYPVSITIYDLASDPHFNIYDELEEFLSAYNIKSLELPLLSQTCPILPLLLAELPEERITHLESLSLTDLEPGRQELLLLNNARYPCLRELQLIGQFVGDMRIFPWKSLRRLDASTALLPMMQCLHILRESVSLEVCFLGISSDTGSESTVGHLNLPTLHELTLSFDFDADILTFEKCGFWRFWSEVTLRWSDLEYSRMMQRSNRPLIHLAIQSSEVDAHSVLQSSPMLVEANFHRAKFREETLDDLATGRLAPLLQHFCVDNISGVDDSAFSEMIERRTQNSVSIGGTGHRLMPFSSVMGLGGPRMNANFDIVYPPRQPTIAYFHETNISRLCGCISCISRT
ncbi:hypothetical protein F5887DRAFT_997266 [Amanita rubescens]|nr:hypothetical protein F5887DRAFT_997266 [Amanita rubescens]